MSDTDLKEKEESAVLDNMANQFSPEQQAEFDALSNNDGLYKGSGGKDKRNISILKRAGKGGGIAGLIIAGCFGAFTVLQGPLQIIHFSQLLQRFHFLNDQEFMNGRTGRLIKYARTRNTPQKRNLSYIGNKLADRYEVRLQKRGMSPVYQGGRTGRLNAIDIDPTKPEGARAINDMHARGITDFNILDDGRMRVNLSGTSAGARRQSLAGLVDSLDLNKVSSTVAVRKLKIRGQVDFHPLKNITRAKDEKFFDYVKRRQEIRDANRRNGATAGPRGVSAEGNDPDGDPANNPAGAGTAAAEAGEILGEMPPPDASAADIEKAASSFKSKLSRGAGVAGAVALVCGLHKLGEAVPDLKHANLVAPLIRIGVETVAMGSQVMTGQDLNMDELGAMTKQLNEAEREIKEADGSVGRTMPASSWVGARSIQAENGQPQTGPDMPAGAKPNTEKPLFFEKLNNTVSSLKMGSVCDAVTTTGGAWAIDIFSWVATAAGPTGLALSAATDIAIGVGIGTFMDDVIRWLVGSPLAMDAAGATFGNYANYGARLASNDASIAHGGMALTSAQSAALDVEKNEMLKMKLRSQPVYVRYFDLKEPDSVASKIAFSPTFNSFTNPNSMVASILRSPFAVFSSIGKNLTPRVVAASTYDYGFPEFGFSPEERDHPDNEDPIAIADKVEGNLAALNEKYGKCFNTKVDPVTFEIKTENQSFRYDRLDEPDYKECTNRSNRELTEYRFYLADLTTAKSLACYEGIDEAACRELGFGAPIGSASSEAGAGGLGISPDGFVFPLQTTKATITANPSSTSRWCYQSPANCHHDYNAADIFAPTGTIVVAARGGTVVKAADNDSSKAGSRVVIKGSDGNLYYYTHMGEGTITVRVGETVAAGHALGKIGTRADAMGTDMHLHFDILPSSYSARPNCSGSACASYPFINVQPVLAQAFNGLP